MTGAGHRRADDTMWGILGGADSFAEKLAATRATRKGGDNSAAVFPQHPTAGLWKPNPARAGLMHWRWRVLDAAGQTVACGGTFTLNRAYRYQHAAYERRMQVYPRWERVCRWAVHQARRLRRAGP